MPEPSVGQPFTPPLGLRFSTGDGAGAAGSAAYQGVTIGAAGDIPPPSVISVLASPTFTLTTYLRGASDFGAGWFDSAVLGPPPATIEHHIRDAVTGAVVGTFGGGTPVAIAAPPGASPPAAGETVNWYAATSPAIAAGAGGLGGQGTYVVLTHVHGNGNYIGSLACFHDGTYIMVTA